MESQSQYDPEALAKAHLLPSEEECQTLVDAVTPLWLAQAVEDLLSDQPAFLSLLPDEEARHKVMRAFSAIPLSPPLAYKLTMARDLRPEVLNHSIQVGYCAAALAHHSRQAPHEIVNAAVAGLFHDIGLLHVAPELLDATRALTERERHHLYSHPMIGYLILEHSPIWHPIVSTAVLEHHERIDGSGYPKGLVEAHLGSLGQLLAVAEIAATLMALGGDYASRDRLSIVLRMNAGKLNHDHCSRLLAMFPPCSVPAEAFQTPDIALELLLNLSVAMLRWDTIAGQSPTSPLARFLTLRLTQLRRSLAEVGIDLEYWSTFHDSSELDGRALGEMEVAAREAIWQLHAIANEAYRRWDHLLPGSEPIADPAQQWLSGIGEIQPAQ
ncbi:MAG TPA: HD domain-containing phosphohydrolase [Rhodocyclaceae bacterium]